MGDIIDVDLFSLKYTYMSAQPITFYGDYDQDTGALSLASDKYLINVKQSDKNLIVHDATPEKIKYVRDLFRLDMKMDYYYKKINTDFYMEKAIAMYEGMRVTKDDPWVTTVTFILSQFNNVKRIRKITKNLIENYGTLKVDEDSGNEYKYMPPPEVIKSLSEEQLLKCGTGFRAKYLIEAARYCTENVDLYKLNPNNYDKLKENLMEIKGIGSKVADCIILMGYGNFNAFPIDVWMKRTLENLYFNSEPQKVKDLHSFAMEKWGKYRGLAQQYIFFYGMNNISRGNKDAKK